MVSEISTCMDRTDPSLNSSHVDTQQRNLFSWKTCANYVILAHRKKKSFSPSVSESPASPPIQQLHSGCHSEPKWERVMEVLLHDNGRRSPVWPLFSFIPADLLCLSAASLWTRVVWNTFQADMGYYNRSSECCAAGVECVGACACVCEITSQPSRATPCNTTAVAEG